MMDLTRVLASISSNQDGINTLSQQLSTGKRVNSAKDDPLAYVQSMELKARISTQGAYLSNIDATTSMLQTEDTALSSVISHLQNVRNALAQAMNGGASSSDIKSQATVAASEFQGLLDVANHKTTAGYMFSGTATGTMPFTQTAGGVTYNGNTGLRYAIVSETMQVAANDTGQNVFQPGTPNDVFALVQNVATALSAGTPPANGQAMLTQLNDQIDRITNISADVGSRMQMLQSQSELLTTINTQLQVRETTLTSVDFATAATQLSQRQTQAQAMYQMIADLTSDKLNIFNYIK